MKILNIFLLLLLLFASTTPQTWAKPDKRPLDIESITMRFTGSGASVTVDFDFPSLTKMYILLLGSKNLEPEINSLFSNFDIEILKINQDEAVLKLNKIARFDKGYYLHESRELGANIKKMYIYTPDSPRPREFTNLNSTPNIFYHG